MPEKDARSSRQPVVLVCPLDWGLGHASRMIPVIRSFQLHRFTVLIGGSGMSGKLLQNQFPDLLYIPLPSVEITYARRNSQMLALMFQLPGMFGMVRREQWVIRRIIRDHRVDILVSDNRYGLYSRHAHTILVTHQLSPVLPPIMRFLELPLGFLVRLMICRFDECWIPDVAERKRNVSGALSHRYRLPANARYIGMLSRFTAAAAPVKAPPDRRFELVIISSGPEPQAGIFIKMMAAQAARLPYRSLIICGFMDKYLHLASMENSELVMVTHLVEEDFRQALLLADTIICRPGYSTLMDLITLGRSAILVPTPGQPEQEYLARRLAAEGTFLVCSQKRFVMQTAIRGFRGLDHVKIHAYKTAMTGTVSMNPEYLRTVVRTEGTVGMPSS